MKANEYIKKYGLVCANIEVAEIEHSKDFDGFYLDLKRLIKSHELVESCGGLSAANKTICDAFHGSNHPIPDGHEELSLAIQDVESCQ